MTLFSLDLVLFSIWHTTLPVCQCPFRRYSTAKSIFLITAHWPESSANCDFLVIWHVIDIDEEKVMDSSLNLVGHLLLGKLLETKTFNFDLYDSPYQEIGEHYTKLGGQIKLVNFVPESIVPNVVKSFFHI